MCKITLFRIIHARNQITKTFIVPWKTCRLVELEPVEIQNAKNLTSFWNKDKYIEKKKVLANLSDLISNFIFFKVESMFCEPCPKETNQYSYYWPSWFRGMHETNTVSDLTLPPCRKSIRRTLY